MTILSCTHNGETYVRDKNGNIADLKWIYVEPDTRDYQFLSESLPDINPTVVDALGVMMCLIDRETVSICGWLYPVEDLRKFINQTEPNEDGRVFYEGWWLNYDKIIKWLEEVEKMYPRHSKETLKVVEKITKGL